jgi:hypothetical protein
MIKPARKLGLRTKAVKAETLLKVIHYYKIRNNTNEPLCCYSIRLDTYMT